MEKENYMIKIVKGKKYLDEKLIYEGEYLDVEQNGKGKEYGINGEIFFQREFLNGKKWNGKGKEYDNFGMLKFEDIYLNGKRKNNKNRLVLNHNFLIKIF